MTFMKARKKEKLRLSVKWLPICLLTVIPLKRLYAFPN